MPIPLATVGFAISLAAGIVKLGGRIDRILAEQEAVRRELALPDRPLIMPPPAFEMKRTLQQLVSETAGQTPDPLRGDRPRMSDLLAQANPAEDQLLKWMQKYLPGEIKISVDDPSGDFERRLRERWDLDEETLRASLYYVDPGKDLRSNTLAWQLSMAIVDVLAEFALENQSLLIRNKQAQLIVAAVLTRFAEPELEQIGSWGGLLKHVLHATLNGALDARDAFDGHKEWLDGLLEALSRARETSANGDDYVLGLLQGRGYRTLVSALLQEGAEYLSAVDANGFKHVITALLQEAAHRVRASASFQAFFQEHWSDLVHAGLQAIQTHGPVLLKGTDPLLHRTLLAVVETLAQPGDHTFLSRAVFSDVVGSVIGAIATQPDLLNNRQWLQDVLGSVAAIVREQEGSGLLSPTSLESVLRGALATIAGHPEVLVDKPGLAGEIVGSVLGRLSSVSGLRLEQLAAAAASGVLEAVTENPGLLDTRYANVIGTVAEELARLVSEQLLTHRQVADLLRVVTEVVSANPQLFVELHDRLTQEVIDAILRATQADPQTLIQGAALVLLTRQVLEVVATRGLGLLGTGDATQLGERLHVALTVGLELASHEIGRRLDLPRVPLALGAFVRAWALGKVPVLEVNDAALMELFAGLAEGAIAAGA